MKDSTGTDRALAVLQEWAGCGAFKRSESAHLDFWRLEPGWDVVGNRRSTLLDLFYITGFTGERAEKKEERGQVQHSLFNPGALSKGYINSAEIEIVLVRKDGKEVFRANREKAFLAEARAIADEGRRRNGTPRYKKPSLAQRRQHTFTISPGRVGMPREKPKHHKKAA